MTRLVTAVAVVVTYVALVLAVNAGIDLRHRNALQDAPAQVVAYRAASARGDVAETRAIAEWFADRVPSVSRYQTLPLGEPAESYDARLFLAKIEREREAAEAEFEDSSAVARPWLAVAAVLVVAALLLRHRRRSANAEAAELVSRFVPPRPRWRRPVFLVFSGVGWTLLAAGFVGGVTALNVWKLPWSVRGYFLLGVVVVLPVAYFVLRYSRPRSARSAVQTLRADGRKPVLYLRSFGDDHDAAEVDGMPGLLPTTGLLNVHTREEQVVAALEAFGPVIAVGRPGEPLPRLGAARFYLPFDDWQSGVLRLMGMSQLIVLRLGEGDGLWWELDQVGATQPAGKLVLMVPGDQVGLADRLHEHLPKPSELDDVLTRRVRWMSAVVAFHPDWTPQVTLVGPFAGDKGSTDTAGTHVAVALQEALGKVGVHRESMKFRARGRIFANFGRVLLLVPGLVLVVLVLRLIFLW